MIGALMFRLAIATVTVAFALGGDAASALGQGTIAMDSATAAQVDRIVARANAEGLPGDAVRAKAREGVSRGVPGERVVRVVAAYADTLRVARDILGAGPNRANEELVAVAQTLSGGVSRRAATALAQAARARAGSGSGTVPFVVAGDLVARGVPGDSAALAVTTAVRRGASDAELWRLREAIVRDIADGASPLEAAMVRSGAEPARAPAGTAPATSPPPGPP